MVGATRDLSVRQQQQRQHRERLAGTVGLIVCAAAFAIALVMLTGPLPLVLGLGALVGAVALVRNPRLGLYLLLFCSLFLEQWGIAGLDPVTARLPFYQTLAGVGALPVPVSPLEMVLLLTLATVVLPLITRSGTKSGPRTKVAPLRAIRGTTTAARVRRRTISSGLTGTGRAPTPARV